MSNVLNLVSEDTFVDQTDDIVEAINAIGGGGSGFDLLPSGTVTITNGRFSLPYQGTPPANTAKIILVDKPKGIHDDVTFGVSFANGVANFVTSGLEGIMTVDVDCIVIIGTYTKKITFSNFPVHYVGEFESQPSIELRQNGDDWIGTVDLFPKNVSPAAEINYSGKILLSDGDEHSAFADCVIENGTITISNAPSWSELELMNLGTLIYSEQSFFFTYVQGE